VLASIGCNFLIRPGGPAMKDITSKTCRTCTGHPTGVSKRPLATRDVLIATPVVKIVQQTGCVFPEGLVLPAYSHRPWIANHRDLSTEHFQATAWLLMSRCVSSTSSIDTHILEVLLLFIFGRAAIERCRAFYVSEPTPLRSHLMVRIRCIQLLDHCHNAERPPLCFGDPGPPSARDSSNT
jgi:hypothetical protein